jgi:flagellar assembly factor FliW
MTVDLAETGERLPTIEFTSPLPGFPEHRRFVLTRTADDGLVYTLRSADDPDLRFVVVPPAPFYPDYAPEVGEQVIEQLASTRPEEDLLVLLVVTVGSHPRDATANLLAPIVVDKSSMRAVQVVLDQDLPVRVPLLPA